MRHRPRRAAGTVATAATALLGLGVESADSAQVRGSLTVTVQVVAACGGAVGGGGQATVTQGCPAADAPLAVTTESASATPVNSSAPSSARIEVTGEVRYVTLIY